MGGGLMKFSFSGKQDIYLEIAERYKEYIRLGVIKNGEKLPSVRQAAGELSVNPNTIARAYAKLEEDGYICSLPKKGVYVTYGGDGSKNTSGDDGEENNTYISLIYSLRDSGVSRETVLKWIEEVYGSHD
jgi:GntR family transcriptional regulator